MSRVAKIARLPWATREDLNFRLRNGESGPDLVEWLNELPEVKEVLAEDFGGVPVTEQNLSTWRKGAYQDWLARQDGWESAEDLVAEANALKGPLGEGKLSEGLSAVLASKCAWVLANWRQLGEAGLERELKSLRVMGREVERLRKGDHNVVRLELRKERDANHMEACTVKQWTKLVWDWAQKNSRISSWLRREWPNEDDAVRYFWRSLDYPPDKIEAIMAEPDKVPPWEKWKKKEPAESDSSAERAAAAPVEAKPENN